MISLPFRRNRASAASIAALYGMIVAQARKPAFYQSYGVPDTVEGRLDMIVLHLILAMRALGVGQSAGQRAGRHQAISQALFDHFCRDIDGNLREMGIGDLAVPKHMQRVAGTFYGRAEVYGAALDAGDDAALQPPSPATCSAPPSRRWAPGGSPPICGRQAGGIGAKSARRAGERADFPDPADDNATMKPHDQAPGRSRHGAFRSPPPTFPRPAAGSISLPTSRSGKPSSKRRASRPCRAWKRSSISPGTAPMGCRWPAGWPRRWCSIAWSRSSRSKARSTRPSISSSCRSLSPPPRRQDRPRPPSRRSRCADGAVDLGAIATEFLLLGIDPYPRKPGAVFDAPVAEDDPSSHPFAALAALKKPGDPNQG